eukprot:6075629-Prymnesium_polylepis.1
MADPAHRVPAVSHAQHASTRAHRHAQTPLAHARAHALSRTTRRWRAVLLSGRPVTFGGVSGDALLANVSGLLSSYPPGQEGGEALARVLAGDAPPGGKLSFSWPRRPGPS